MSLKPWGKVLYLIQAGLLVGALVIPLSTTQALLNWAFELNSPLLIDGIIRGCVIIGVLTSGFYFAPRLHQSFGQVSHLKLHYQLLIGVKQYAEMMHNMIRLASQNKALVYGGSVLLVVGAGFYLQVPGDTQQFSFIYATLLFFQVLIARQTPLLTLGANRSKQETGTEETVRTQEVWNAGTETAHNVQISFQLYNQDGKPIRSKKTAIIPTQYRSLEPGKSIPADDCELHYVVDDEFSEEAKYHLHIVAQTGSGISLLTDSKWITLA